MAIDPMKKPEKADSSKNDQALSIQDPATFSFDKNQSYEKILAIKQMDSNRELNQQHDENQPSNLGSNRDMQPFLHDAMGSVIISSTSLGSNL